MNKPLFQTDDWASCDPLLSAAQSHKWPMRARDEETLTNERRVFCSGSGVCMDGECPVTRETQWTGWENANTETRWTLRWHESSVKTPEPWTINELNGETKINTLKKFILRYRRMTISSKCIRQTRLLNIEQSLKFKDHHFTMKQSTAPLYRGWYGCDLVKFGEMLTAKRTCAVAIGVFKTPLRRNLLIKMNQH